MPLWYLSTAKDHLGMVKDQAPSLRELDEGYLNLGEVLERSKKGLQGTLEA